MLLVTLMLCQSINGWTIKRFIIFLCLALPSVTLIADDTALQREQFLAAEKELKTGLGPRYKALREKLEDYPLAIYLDYAELIERLHTLQPQEAKLFLSKAKGSPLESRFLAAYLEHKGRDRHWQELLGVMDAAPNDPRLQCFYYRAQRSIGNHSLAWKGAAQLWNTGRSQDEACDPLFERWIKEGGGPDDDVVWSRALKAFDARRPQLIRYVQRFASPDLRAMLDELLSVYRHPDRLVSDAHEPNRWHAQLMTAGIRRLARVNPEQGRKALLNAQSVQSFTDLEVEAMEKMILRHSLFTQASAPDQWLLDRLERLADDEMTEIYLRNQVSEGDWSTLLKALPWLSKTTRRKDQWRYWWARALEESGQWSDAEVTYRSLAQERSYHGFLAADRLALDYQLNALSPPSSQAPADLGVVRVRELMALDRVADAKVEWRKLLSRLNTQAGARAAQWAMEQGWADLAIDAANHVKAWDIVDLRFPEAFAEDFANAAANNQVDSVELMAIARRESAFYPRAQSDVGARGLMQLMPGTAKQVAKRLGLPYRHARLFDPDYNVTLGSRYYQSLLERFDGHRPKALAGYNAGPHRVDRWSQRDIPVDQWIDSLPFRETREYVQAVLAYTVIYRARAGEPGKLLTQEEWSLTNTAENL